jgi:hypothetical protein
LLPVSSQSCPTSPATPMQRPLTRSSTLSPKSTSSSRLRSARPAVSPLARPGAKKSEGTRGSSNLLKLNDGSELPENPIPPTKADHAGPRSKGRKDSPAMRLTRSATQPVSPAPSAEHSPADSARVRQLRAQRRSQSHSSERGADPSGDNELLVASMAASSVRTLRSGAQSQTVAHSDSASTTSTCSNASKTSKGVAAPAENGPSTRRSLRTGNPFEAVENKKQGETDARGVKRTAQEAFDSPESGSNVDNCGSKDNPFAKSKAQTQLFSSSVMQQARRSWPAAKDKVVPPTQVRSGVTVGVGAVALADGGGARSPASDRSGSVHGSAKLGRLRRFESSSSCGGDSVTMGVSSPPHSPASSLSSPTRKAMSPWEMMTVLESTKVKASKTKVVPSCPTSEPVVERHSTRDQNGRSKRRDPKT